MPSLRCSGDLSCCVVLPPTSGWEWERLTVWCEKIMEICSKFLVLTRGGGGCIETLFSCDYGATNLLLLTRRFWSFLSNQGATKLKLLIWRIWSFLGHLGLPSSYFSHVGFDPSSATRGYKAPTSHMEDLILPRPPGATKLLLLTCRIWSFLGHPGLQSSYFLHVGFDPSLATRGYKAPTSHMEDLILPWPPGATKLLLVTCRIWSFLGHQGLQSSYFSHGGFDPSSATRGYKAPTCHM